MTYQPSSWHAVAVSRKLGSAPQRVMIEGRAFVVFRSGHALHCLTDRSPHRFAPLSRGRGVGDTIECPYHGWRFDGVGHGRAIPGLLEPVPNVVVPSHPVREQSGLIYISPGDPRGEP